MSEKRAAGSVVMTHAVGLHARPSVKLTKLAKTFASRVELAVAEEGPWIDDKSIVKHGHEGAERHGSLLPQDGEEAEESVDALVALVARDFDEASGAPGEPAHAGAP